MADKIFNDFTERLSPTGNEFALVEVTPGVYQRVKLSNLGVTGGGGATPLSTPTLTATVASSTQINLSWTNVANESSYQLQRSTDNVNWTTIGGTIAANTTTYNDTGLTASTLYYYRVKAVGDGVTYSDSAYGTDSDTTSGSTLHQSSFTATNGTAITAYTPETGSGWTNSFGTGEIQGNKAVPATFTTGEWQSFTTLSQNTYTLTAEITGVVAKTAYIFFRRVDGNNMMFLNIDHSVNTVKLYKVVAGVVTQVGTDYTPSPTINDNAAHTYVLTVGASTCSLTIDGNSIFTGAAIDAAASGNVIGIGATGSGVAAGDIAYNYVNVVP